jgi:hypothetical protein
MLDSRLNRYHVSGRIETYAQLLQGGYNFLTTLIQREGCVVSSNLIFFGWDRPVPGREQMSVEHFGEFLEYLTGLQRQGAIDSFEPVLLNPHGGDLNGFLLIRGNNDALDALVASDEWMNHVSRGGLHLEGMGLIRGASGDLVMEWMERYSRIIP